MARTFLPEQVKKNKQLGGRHEDRIIPIFCKVCRTNVNATGVSTSHQLILQLDCGHFRRLPYIFDGTKNEDR